MILPLSAKPRGRKERRTNCSAPMFRACTWSPGLPPLQLSAWPSGEAGFSSQRQMVKWRHYRKSPATMRWRSDLCCLRATPAKKAPPPKARRHSLYKLHRSIPGVITVSAANLLAQASCIGCGLQMHRRQGQSAGIHAACDHAGSMLHRALCQAQHIARAQRARAQ